MCTQLLTKPLNSYEQRVPNNLAALKKTLRKGDVLLVEGNQRVSQVIRYLTQSSWSHSTVYVGDHLLHGDPAMAAELRERFGEDAEHLLIEAEVGAGVIASPLSKYERLNIRICRPQQIQRDDVERVMDYAVGHMGTPYDVRHICDLGLYFFPVSLVPRRWRRGALQLGRGSSRAVICSCMIGKAFARVGYPILPEMSRVESAVSPARRWQRLLRRNGRRTLARFRQQDLALITPRDFDLSPYFEIVKFNHLADPSFSYRDIVWEDDLPAERGAPELLPPPLAAAAAVEVVDAVPPASPSALQRITRMFGWSGESAVAKNVPISTP